MPRFRYKATDAEGNPLTGEMEASGVEEVTARLKADGAKVESVVELKPGSSAADSSGGGPSARLRGADFRELGGHLGDLADAGLPLVQGLRALSQELPNRRLRSGLQSMVAQLESGADLADVLRSHGAPPDLRALVAAGFRSGHAAELLGRYAAQYRRVSAVRMRAVLALVYPLLVIPLVGVAAVFILVGIVPGFKEIFKDFAVQLPWLTAALVAVSDFVVAYGVWVLAAGALLGAALWVIAAFVLDAATRRQIVCSIPVVGTLLRFTALSRFVHLLAMLVENNVPLPQALALAGEGAGDAELQAACWQLAGDVEAGREVEETARQMPGLPATVVQTLAWQKQGRAFPDALRALADMFEARAHSQTELAAAVWQPVLLILAGAGLVIMIFALFAPLIKLISGLGY